jgi:hypothetical protein
MLLVNAFMTLDKPKLRLASANEELFRRAVA